MKRQRQEAIARAIRKGSVRNQKELVELLYREGFTVSQTTVSRDLRELGLSRSRDSSGSLIYTNERSDGPQEDFLVSELRRIAKTSMLSAEATGNLVVVKTSPGNAQGLAWALDRATLEGVVGTVAGDDTIMVVCSEGSKSGDIAGVLMSYALGER